MYGARNSRPWREIEDAQNFKLHSFSKTGLLLSRRTMVKFSSRCSKKWFTLNCCMRRHGQIRTFPARGRREYATISSLDSNIKPGDDLHGFALKRLKTVPELQLTAVHLQHKQTGADYLHIARDDRNNVFSIGFKTNPPDATGVPHILEHTTLCGSKKLVILQSHKGIGLIICRYPVRDPFFKMLRRSLSNFMNAFTSSDHTSYPFATTNSQDFKNLLSVYLDATLHPLLKENDFTQEGWRVGPANPKLGGGSKQNGEDNNLVFKGVVYNEMKGQMSDASYLYYIRFQELIMPALNNSGGDPSKMTDLKFGDLKSFHAENYHPSNAKIFTYGDMPLADHAKELNRHLSGFSKSQSDQSVKEPISLQGGPIYNTQAGPVDPMLDPAMQYKTSTSWLLGDTSDILETFSLGLMSSLLLDGYGSPIYQALIESGLGPDYTPNTGFDGSSKIGVFSVGLNGVRKEDVPKVEKVLKQKLQIVYEEGFDKRKVEGILHQLELSLRHKTANFGMNLMQRLEPSWFNGADPFNALAWDETVNAFKARFNQGGYIEGLLKKYLLNDKTITFTMKPSLSYAEEVHSEEKLRLASKIQEAVSKAGDEGAAHKGLVDRELELLEEQSKAPDQDLSSLPTLHVRDIPRESEKKPTRDSSIGSVKVQWREAGTNGLTYFRAIQRMDGLPAELRMLIPLFTDSIMRLGTKDKTMEELEDLIKLKTGGIGVAYHSSPSPTDMRTCTEGLSFSGQALDDNVPAMYELLQVLVQETNFDGPEAESKVRQLLQADASGALDAIASSGHSYARKYAESGITTQGMLSEQVGGLTQVQQIANLANRRESEGMNDIITKLKRIQHFALSSSSSLRTAITCDQESSVTNETALNRFLSGLPEGSVSQSTGIPFADTASPITFFPLPYQVSYAAASLPTVSYADDAGAPLQILSQLLTHKHLHHEIREKGGAYGGGAYARGLSGLFGFYSYRDPNPQNTLNIIRDAGRWARDKDWTDQDLEEAKLSTFQSVDAPQSVSDEGITKFLSGVDQTMEQKKREQLLDVKREDLRDVAQRYLVEGMKDVRIAVLGEKKNWVKEEDGWSIKKIELSKLSETAGASDLEAGDLDRH